MKIKIGVIVVAYDSGQYLESAIASVYEAASKSQFTVDCIVIDNHPESKDSLISTKVSHYEISRQNLGFGAGCNIGIGLCLDKFHTDYVLLLNPDACLQDDFFLELEKLMEVSQDPIIGPISPLILLDLEIYKANLGTLIDIDQDEVITLIGGHQDFKIYDSVGHLVSEFSGSHIRAKGDYWIVSNEIPRATSFAWCSSINTSAPMKLKDLNLDEFVSGYIVNNAGSYVSPPYVAGDIGFQDLYISEKFLVEEVRSVWCGACVILSKEFLEEVGRFDEDFFLYYEDIDFSLRGTSKGYVTTFYPNLVCMHGHSKSTSRNMKIRSQNIWRSRSLFVSKTYGNHLAILLVIKLIMEVFKSSPNRSHIKHVRRNLIPEINATLQGILRLK